MSALFPSASALSATFGNANPYHMPAARRSPYAARTELYGSWNVAEDAKQKSTQLADAATKEYEKASQLAQQKAGKIELYSGKYYACAPSLPQQPPIPHRAYTR